MRNAKFAKVRNILCEILYSMTTSVRAAIRFILFTLLAIVITALTFYFQRLAPGVTGNMCGSPPDYIALCYEPLPRGGFPFAFLVDQGGVTGQGHLSTDDRWRWSAFMLDSGFYFLLLYFGWRGGGYLLKKKNLPSPTNQLPLS